jgi:hypothetical protein
MKLGLQIPDFTWPNGASALGSDLAAIARTADQAGFDSIAVMDHFFQISAVGPVENDMLEAYTTLGFLPRTPNARNCSPSSPVSSTDTPGCSPRRSRHWTSSPAAARSSASARAGTRTNHAGSASRSPR